MTKRLARTTLFAVLAATLLSLAAPSSAAPIPSKPAPDAAPAGRAADETSVRAFLARRDVARALAGTGLTAPEVEQRLARLSDDDLRSLAANLDQVQAAGTEVPRYIWLLLAVFLGVLILAAIF
ncbi:MAG: PA2779 family protein [Acidobacteriia bacterium]|nr:PA2779 family protein [Terriglobia bacterium]